MVLSLLLLNILSYCSFFSEIIYSALTPLESRKSIAACVGSKVLSPGRKLGIPAPRDARRLASPSPEARRIKVPAE